MNAISRLIGHMETSFDVEADAEVSLASMNP